MSGETCSFCSRVADPVTDGDPPLAWTSDRIPNTGATKWICPSCTRQYVRSIEAKLDQEWF